MVKAIIFDWGDTLMRDHPELPGPMASWPTVELIPGAAEALAALDRVGIRTYFHHLYTSKELGAAKPSPGSSQRSPAAWA